MKIVFMGTPEFASICLEEILTSQHKIVGVVTVPDKPAGRGQKFTESAISQFAKKKDLKLLKPDRLKNADFLKELQNLEADCFVVVAFRMLPKEVWQIPPKGTFNLHASLLPQYRGAAPINWAILNGEKETGVTTFMIDEKIDTGNILLQEKVSIDFQENAGDVHDKLAKKGKQLIIQTLNGLEKGNLKATPQIIFENLKVAPKIFKEDCKINWENSIEKIYNTIRGLSPYPTAWTHFIKEDNNLTVKLYKARFELCPNSDKNLGQLSFENHEILIKLKDGNLYIQELQPEGKRRMKAVDFINGLHEKNGWKLA